MTHSTLYRIIAVLALLLVGINPGRATIAAPDVPTQAQSVEGPRQPPVVLRADPNVSIQRVPAPASMRSAQHTQSASIIINYMYLIKKTGESRRSPGILQMQSLRRLSDQ